MDLLSEKSRTVRSFFSKEEVQEAGGAVLEKKVEINYLGLNLVLVFNW